MGGGLINCKIRKTSDHNTNSINYTNSNKDDITQRISHSKVRTFENINYSLDLGFVPAFLINLSFPYLNFKRDSEMSITLVNGSIKGQFKLQGCLNAVFYRPLAINKI